MERGWKEQQVSSQERGYERTGRDSAILAESLTEFQRIEAADDSFQRLDGHHRQVVDAGRPVLPGFLLLPLLLGAAIALQGICRVLGGDVGLHVVLRFGKAI